MRALLLLACLLSGAEARAATIAGGDYGGADLAPANGDVLSGTFVNVGHFQVGSGTTVFVAAGVPLAVYASSVSIAGTLDASGRGQAGGSGGAAGGGGSSGFGGGPSGAGAGIGGGALRGGGGGAHGGAGGSGGGSGGGAAGGAVYDSTGATTVPISADDVFQGSGGGGGGGGSATPGGSGAAGGGAVYIEAASMTVTGSILLQGATAPAGIAASGTNPGGGGGGSGGGLALRVTGALLMSGARVSAVGGAGGNVIDPLGSTNVYPGGGGGGGRVKLFAKSETFSSVSLSTSGGAAGGNGGIGGIVASSVPAAGGTGSVSFGVIASSPTSFAAQTVTATSIDWSWNAPPSFGDAPSASQAYRVFPATAAAPLTSPEASVAAPASGATSAGLTPNTTYTRFATAFTDWGDSYPSDAASTHTLASPPASAPFAAVSETSLTASWSAGSPANPSYTQYQVQAALDAGFATGLQDGFVTALSSSPAGLAPNTTYYVRTRAVNLDGVPTAYTAAMATATWAQAPAGPAVGPVWVASASFAWSGGANPPDTRYVAEVSSDNFFSLTGSSATLTTSATFFGLTAGTQYFFRVRAANRSGTLSDYSTVLSTRAGNLADTSPPSAPGRPAPDRAFSYDGTVTFAWAPASSAVGILDYELLIGSFPGGNDVFNGAIAVDSYTATGLATGRTYYAQVRARSNAGSVGPFSPVSAGVPVFRAASTPAIAKPYAWPNPFNPSAGPVQIGFFLEAPADVTLRLYTLNGRLLRETSAHFGSSGNQIASWDGSDSSGRRAAPGGYIVELRKHYAGRTDSQRVKVAVLY